MSDDGKAPTPHQTHPDSLIEVLQSQPMSLTYLCVFLLMEQYLLKVYYEPGTVSSVRDP